MAYAIKKGSDYMNTVLWTGNSTADRAITGVGFQPDLVWLKTRSNAGQSHHLVDSVRGLGSNIMNTVHTNRNNPEDGTGTNSGAGYDTYYGAIQSIDSDGFTVDKTGNDSYQQVNNSTWTYAAWNWKLGGSAVSNSDGTITSSVLANQTAGFSICTYTGNGTGGATIGHGLGTTPKFVTVRRRNGNGGFPVYHSGIGATKYVSLYNGDAASTVSTIWNNTAPTSSVFSVGTDAWLNASSGTYVAYCWAEVPGYSKIGTFTGNGSADGPFVYTGFKPSWILIKNTSTDALSWVIHDTTRRTFNYHGEELYPNGDGAAANASTERLDILSNGFKLRTTANSLNASSGNMIYMAFAECPFKYANAL